MNSFIIFLSLTYVGLFLKWFSEYFAHAFEQVSRYLFNYIVTDIVVGLFI
jgi:hypothetical protein